jgi:Integrase core domain
MEDYPTAGTDDDESKNLGKLYTSSRLSGSFSGVQRFMHSRGLTNLKAVKSALAKVPSYSKFRPARKRFPRLPVRINFVNWQWVGDLLDTSSYYKSRGKREKKFALVAIDGFSKKLFLEKLKDKKSKSVVEAFKIIFERAGVTPKLLQTDMGGEFLGRESQAYFKKLGIEQFSTHSYLKGVLVERANRTIRNYLARALYANPKSKWTDFIEDFEESYNNTVHSSHKFTPNEASLKKNEGQVWLGLYGKYLFQKPDKPRFSVGTRVRVSKEKLLFSKSSEQNFTGEIFIISKVLKTSPVTYQLSDLNKELIQGRYYFFELTPASE